MAKSFEDLRKIYEQGVNLDEISTEEKDILFLKVRSLTKKNLFNLCLNKEIINEGEKYSDWELRKKVFDNFSHDELNKFIEDNLEEEFSEEQIENLAGELKNIEEHAPAVFMDSFDTVLRRIVRDKKINSLTALREKIKDGLAPRLSSYVEWSWFNQNANDLIENIFNVHEKILPTLRRVKGIDFFIKTDKVGIPVDLKLTFLPKEFISIYKKKENLSPEETLEKVKENPKLLADWFYENQNPHLFNNNKRLFIILVDKSNFEESWKLKAEYELIKSKVNNFLGQLSLKDVIKISYDYTKDEKVSGNYKTDCFLLIIERD